MSDRLLTAAVEALGDLAAQVVFLGGATVPMWLTDPGARQPRTTIDVDVVVDIAGPVAFAAFQDQLRRQGFQEDIDSGVTCRWRHRDRPLLWTRSPLTLDSAASTTNGCGRLSRTQSR